MDQDKSKEKAQENLNENFRSSITENDLPEAQKWLDQGAQINSQTSRGGTALTIAMNFRNKKAFDWLIKQGADINIPDNEGETLLMRAVRTDYMGCLDSLIASGVNLNATDGYGMSALLYACSYRACEFIEKLVDAGADINIETSKKSNALLVAASSGTYRGVVALINKKANVESKDWQGQTPLLAATHRGTKDETSAEKKERLDIVTCLLENNANPNVRATSGLTPLFTSCLYGLEKISLKLIDAGADVNITHGYMKEKNLTPLHLAAKGGKEKISKKLLDSGADPNCLDSEGNSAAAYGYILPELQEMFLEASGDVNAILNYNKEKVPALSHIILNRDKKMFDKMVKRGVKLYYEDPAMEEYQPLRLSIAVCMPDIAETIFQSAPQDVNVLWGFKQKKSKEKNFMSPLMMLMGNEKNDKLNAVMNQIQIRQQLLNQKDENGNYRLSEEERNSLEENLKPLGEIKDGFVINHDKFFDLLFKNGAKVDFIDRDGNTALFYAKDKKNIESLLNVGANIFHRDNHGLTIFGAAFVTGQIEAAKALNDIASEKNLQADKNWQSTLLDIAYAELPSNSIVMSMAMIKELVPEGDDRLVYREEETGNTPLLVAAATEFGSLAQLLVEKGVSVNQTNNAGETALHHAVATRNALLIDFLLEKGADVTLKSKSGLSAWDVAKEMDDSMVKGIITKHYDPSVDVSNLSLTRRIKAA